MTYPSQQQKRSSDPAAIRGVLVLVVASVIGIVLLANSGTGGIVGDDSGTDEAEPPTVAAEQPTTTTVPQTPVTKPPSQVKVLVLNGTGGKQAYAGRDNRAKLQPLGYQTLNPLDVVPQATAIYYAPGFELDAAAVARTLGLPENAVQPISPEANLPQVAQQANVTAVVGTDQPATPGSSGATSTGGTSTSGTSTGGTSTGGTSTGTSTGGTSTSGTSTGGGTTTG